MINSGNRGGVEEQNKSSSTSPSTAQAIKEMHVEYTHDESPEDEGPIGRIVFTEAARKEARAWFKKVTQPSQEDQHHRSGQYTPLNNSRGKILNFIRERGHTIST